jgi:Ca2+-binding EF-hand superfamily protein
MSASKTSSYNTSLNNFSIEEIITFLKQKIFSMGYEQIRIIGKNLRDTPTYNGCNKINKDDFLTCLRDIGLLLPKAANEKLVQYYDKDIDGFVYFSEFLTALRGTPNDERQKAIDDCFKKFEKDNSGMIDIRDLKGMFNASKHPKVVKGEITQEQAFDEFARNFNDRTGAGKIEKCEWDDYYAAVSASMDNDDHFIELIRSTWGLNEM